MATTDYDHIAQLVQRAQKGSQSAFEELYKLYFSRIYYVALRRLEDKDAAADVTQETFLRILTNLDSLKNPRAFDKWAFTLANHEITEAAGSTGPETVDIENLNEQDTCWLVSTEASPEEQFEQQENHEQLVRAVRALPDKQRDAVILHYFNGMSVTEIAAVLSTSASTVTKRLYDARVNLKAAWPGEPDRVLPAVLRQDAAEQDYESAQEQVSTKLAAIMPALITGTAAGANPHVAARAQAFLPHALTPAAPAARQVVKQAARQAARTAASGSGASASGTAAAPVLTLPARIALIGAAALVVVGGGSYAIYRQMAGPDRPAAATSTQTKTAKDDAALDESVSRAVSQEATLAADTSTGTDTQEKTTTQPDQNQSQAAAANTSSSAVAPSTSQPQPIPQPTPQPAPAPAPVPGAPTITVAYSTLSYPRGTKPSLTRILTDARAAASDVFGTPLTITVTGYENLTYNETGSCPIFLHATDARGRSAKTVTLNIEFR